MPYTKNIHANLGYVDKEYKDLLDKMCAKNKRSIKQQLEVLIVDTAILQNIK